MRVGCGNNRMVVASLDVVLLMVNNICAPLSMVIVVGKHLYYSTETCIESTVTTCLVQG